jgi:hypothetical protein
VGRPVVALSLFATPSLAQTPDSDLSAAEQAYVDLDFDRANQLARAIVQRTGLTHDQLVRAYRVLARTYAVLDREDDARAAFVRLLTFAPNEKEDRNLPPRVTMRLMEARGVLSGYSARPGIEVTASVAAGAGGTLRVTTRDPTHVVRRVLAAWRWGSSGPFRRAEIAVGEEVAVPISPPPVGAARFDYWAQALDELDDVDFESGNAEAPRTTLLLPPVAPSARPDRESDRSIVASPVFWIVGGVVVAAASASVYFLTRKPRSESEPATSADLAPPVLWCGTSPCR